MAKPRKTPPHSDLDGVREDSRRIDVPENSGRETMERLEHERRESKGRPKQSRP